MLRFFSMRFRAVLPLLLCLPALTSVAFAAGPKKAVPLAPAVQPFLPAAFAGWQGGAPKVSTRAEDADAANAPVLAEYGFNEFESETYSRDGATLTVRAMQFGDASGAFGAFTFYRRDGMKPVEAGTDGAFDGGQDVLFWQSGVLVNAVFSEITAMSASELREMAAMLPKLSGGANIPPPMLHNLPTQGLDRTTLRYALGPVSYERGGGVLPTGVIDFKRGAEAVTAQYGDGALTLINNPTPQLAMAQLKAVDDSLAGRNASTATQALNNSNSQALKTRRSGPLVALTSGSLNDDQASRIINSIHYDAQVTRNSPKGYVSEAGKAARLLIGLATLITFGLVFTVIFGLFFGTGRIMFRRLRGKPATTLEENDMIRLNLQ